MLRVGQNDAFATGASASPAASLTARETAQSRNRPPAVTDSTDSFDAFLGTGLSRYELLAMNAGIDETSRKSNALSTASDAIGVIGGLLNNIRGSLTAAAGSAPDLDAEQSRIDGAIVTIDAIAGSTRFGGRNLLDGSFTVPGSRGAVTIPSFASPSLGAAAESETPAPSLATLQTGGENALRTGDPSTRNQIVTTALSQVAGTQAHITGLLSAMAAERSATLPADDASSAATVSSFGADPSAASKATANSSAQRVLALLSI
jgi:flagellin